LEGVREGVKPVLVVELVDWEGVRLEVNMGLLYCDIDGEELGACEDVRGGNAEWAVLSDEARCCEPEWMKSMSGTILLRGRRSGWFRIFEDGTDLL